MEILTSRKHLTIKSRTYQEPGLFQEKGTRNSWIGFLKDKPITPTFGSRILWSGLEKRI